MHSHTQSIAHEQRGLLMMTASVFLFSATALILSYAHDTYAVSGWSASVYRAVTGLLAVSLLQKQTGPLSLSRIFTQRWLFARGLIGGMTIPIYYMTIMKLGPGRAGMIAGSYPLFAAVFAMCFLREPVTRRDYSYICLALLGLGFIFSHQGIGPAQPLYDTVALVGAAAAGICVVLIRHLRHSETTSNIFAAQCVFALILGCIGSKGQIWFQNPNALALVLVASITVVAAQLLLTMAFRYIDVAKGATLQMLTPVCTAVSSAFLLGENFGILEVIGGAAILYASYQIALRKRKA